MVWYGLEFSREVILQLLMFVGVWVLIQNSIQPIRIKKRARILRKKFHRLDSYMKAGIWGTIAVTLFVLLISGFDHCDQHGHCENKITLLLNSSPNEFGDSLAGFAGTLAFLWLITTVLIQSRQLAAQKNELEWTRLEFEKMADAQEKQVEIMDVQKNIFEKEQKQREETEAKEFLESLKQRLFRQIGYLEEASLSWKWEEDDATYYANIESWSEDREERIDKFCESLSMVEHDLISKDAVGERNFISRPHLPRAAPFVENTLRKIKKILPKLSEADRNRAQDLGLDFAVDDWSALARHGEIWNDDEQ